VQGFGSAEEINPAVYKPGEMECIVQSDLNYGGFDQLKKTG